MGLIRSVFRFTSLSLFGVFTGSPRDGVSPPPKWTSCEEHLHPHVHPLLLLASPNNAHAKMMGGICSFVSSNENNLSCLVIVRTIFYAVSPWHSMSHGHAHAHGNSTCDHDHDEAPPTESTSLLANFGSTIQSMLTHSHSHGRRFAAIHSVCAFF